MGRRISNGVVGSGGGLGSILVSGSGNTLTTAGTGQNLIIDPNGTGVTQINTVAELRSAGSLRLYNTTNTFYTALSAVAAAASTYTITLPGSVPGGAGYFLTADTSGNCSWTAPTTAGITVSNDTATSTAVYPLFATAAGSGVSTVYVTTSRLSFIPSTGALTTTEAFHGTVTGGTGSGGNLVLRSTTNATKGQVYIDESTASSSTTSGALRVAGGVGVAGQVTCLTLSATTITETSSITLKENINPITNALNTIVSLVGVIYDRKDGNGKNEAGLIAEDVYKILPNLVTLDDEGNPLAIKYTKLTAYLIESIKELKEEIEGLKR